VRSSSSGLGTQTDTEIFNKVFSPFFYFILFSRLVFFSCVGVEHGAGELRAAARRARARYSKEPLAGCRHSSIAALLKVDLGYSVGLPRLNCELSVSLLPGQGV